MAAAVIGKAAGVVSTVRTCFRVDRAIQNHQIAIGEVPGKPFGRDKRFHDLSIVGRACGSNLDRGQHGGAAKGDLNRPSGADFQIRLDKSGCVAG